MEVIIGSVIGAAILGGLVAAAVGFVQELASWWTSKRTSTVSETDAAQKVYEQEQHNNLQAPVISPIKVTGSAKILSKELAAGGGGSMSAKNATPDIQLSANDGGSEEYPTAHFAIKYRPDAEHAWTKAEKLPLLYKKQFLEALDKDPKLDVFDLLSSLQTAHENELRPFKDDAANDALEQARTISTEAASEFKRVYETFATMVNAAEILVKIENEYGPSAQTAAASQKQLKRLKDQEEKKREKQRELAQERLKEQQRERLQYKLEYAAQQKQTKKSRLRLYLILLILFLFTVTIYI